MCRIRMGWLLTLAILLPLLLTRLIMVSAVGGAVSHRDRYPDQLFDIAEVCNLLPVT